jgi:cell fate (sporulation/competence/biofilm development) regulator YmcA (YheA/YmcA/DUF963 family)
MKQDKLLQTAYKLKDILENDKRIIYLKEIEKQLEVDEEVIKLHEQLKNAEKAYLYAIEQEKYSDDKQGVKSTQKQLHKIKKQFDELELIKQYKQAYQQVRELYENIQKEIFTPFNKHLCGD